MEGIETQKYYKQALLVSARQEGKVVNDIHRGEIYYYQFTGDEVGCEIRGESGVDRRPCVIVSNNKANAFTGLVTVVPMTSKEKSPIPTRVQYEGKIVHGTFLCEQVTTISIERLAKYCGEVDGETMKKIDAALCVQLAVSIANSAPPPAQQRDDADLFALERERNFYKRSYFELIDRLAGRNA